MAWGKQKKHAPIAGLDIGPARLTPLGWFWILVYLGLPIMVLGNLIDAWIQFQWGWCIGIWCVI